MTSSPDVGPEFGLESVTYYTEVAPESEPLSTKIVETVAAIDNTEPKHLPVLSEWINTDALDELFRTNGCTGGGTMDGGVSFRYHHYMIHVDDTGVIRVENAPF